jgi:hypothetical protein
MTRDVQLSRLNAERSDKVEVVLSVEAWRLSVV